MSGNMIRVARPATNRPSASTYAPGTNLQCSAYLNADYGNHVKGLRLSQQDWNGLLIPARDANVTIDLKKKIF
jgi:hypothetical protein